MEGPKLSKSFYFYGSNLSFVLGVLIGSIDRFLVLFNELWTFALAMFCLVLFVAVKNKYSKAAFFIAAFLLLGVWRFVLTFPHISENSLNYYNGEKLEFEGIVASDVVRKGDKQSFVVLGRKKNGQGVLEGRAMVYADSFPEYAYGDSLALVCKLKAPEPFNGFDYARYLAKDGIYSLCYYPRIKVLGRNKSSLFYSAIYAIRHRFAAVIDKGLGEPESGIARATMLGESKIIDKDLQKSYSVAGLSHIIAISGTHITVMAALIYFVLSGLGLGRNRLFYVSLSILTLFIIVAGAPSSAVRSGIMAALLMFAAKIGRKGSFIRAIVFTLALQLAFNPRMLRDDIGLQLSFASILGILYIYPLLTERLEKWKIGNLWKIRDMLTVTMAAQLSTGGIIAYYFGTVPVFGLFANLLVLWTSSLILVSLIVAMLSGLVVGSFEELFFYPVKLLIDYMNVIANFIASLPFSSLSVNIGLFSTLAYYALLVLAIVKFGRYKQNL